MNEAQALHALLDNDTIENILPLVKKQVVEEAPKFTSEEILDALGKNEDGDAAIYIKLNRGRFVYDAASGRWYKWKGHYWELDHVNEALEAVGQVANTYGVENKHQLKLRMNAAANNNKEEEKIHEGIMDELMKRAKVLRSVRRKENVLKLSHTGANSLAIRGDTWDTDPWLFCCKNGVIDLRTGRLNPGRPEDFMRNFSPVEYLGFNEKAPTWDHFIKQIFDGNGELIAFVKRLFGYFLTGHTVHHVAPMLYGTGRNGKGTLVETVKKVMGGYASAAQSELLIAQKFGKTSSQASPDVMALRGKRFVFCSETEEGQRFNVAKLKLLSGGDTMIGRDLYGKDLIQFKPTHKIILYTNYKPHANAKDYAFWKRAIIVPFVLSFVSSPSKIFERQEDVMLSKKLEDEKPGILAWLVRGCLDWQKEGMKLNPPRTVQIATDKYRDEEDVIGQYIRERYDIGPGKEIQAGKAFEDFEKWCNENGHAANQKLFGADMKSRFDYKDGRNVTYLGLCLKE